LSTEGFSPLKNIPEKIITLEKKEFIIPEKYNKVVPFMGGEKIEWSVV
jgi:dihydroorotase